MTSVPPRCGRPNANLKRARSAVNNPTLRVEDVVLANDLPVALEYLLVERLGEVVEWPRFVCPTNKLTR